ncbi:MAG: hybrid sensor histidine kinase/response regulator [Syntrophobacteraceae bacterium]
MNIIVVDDEIDQVETLRRGLRGKGHTVREAQSAQQALNQLQSAGRDIDLVITDYSMPVMNGVELLESIRNNYGDLPVILMTAYGQKDLVVKALHHRCDGFIEKPFTLGELTRVIERATANLAREKARNELSRMVPMLIHQINNPLAAISGSAQMALFSLDKPDVVKKHMDQIVAGAARIQRINREILESSRQEARRLELVEIVSVLEECLNMFKEILSLKGISVERRLTDIPVFVHGQTFALEQLFKNLIMNAVEAMEGKKEKLTLMVTVSKGEGSVCVVIEDTGRGIPANLAGSIFEAYVTSKPYGTGLGLAVARQVTEQLNGEIRTESVEGRGTKFIITIPAAGMN